MRRHLLLLALIVLSFPFIAGPSCDDDAKFASTQTTPEASATYETATVPSGGSVAAVTAAGTPAVTGPAAMNCPAPAGSMASEPPPICAGLLPAGFDLYAVIDRARAMPLEADILAPCGQGAISKIFDYSAFGLTGAANMGLGEPQMFCMACSFWSDGHPAGASDWGPFVPKECKEFVGIYTYTSAADKERFQFAANTPVVQIKNNAMVFGQETAVAKAVKAIPSDAAPGAVDFLPRFEQFFAYSQPSAFAALASKRAGAMQSAARFLSQPIFASFRYGFGGLAVPQGRDWASMYGAIDEVGGRVLVAGTMADAAETPLLQWSVATSHDDWKAQIAKMSPCGAVAATGGTTGGGMPTESTPAQPADDYCYVDETGQRICTYCYYDDTNNLICVLDGVPYTGCTSVMTAEGEEADCSSAQPMTSGTVLARTAVPSSGLKLMRAPSGALMPKAITQKLSGVPAAGGGAACKAANAVCEAVSECCDADKTNPFAIQQLPAVQQALPGLQQNLRVCQQPATASAKMCCMPGPQICWNSGNPGIPDMCADCCDGSGQMQIPVNGQTYTVKWCKKAGAAGGVTISGGAAPTPEVKQIQPSTIERSTSLRILKPTGGSETSTSTGTRTLQRP